MRLCAASLSKAHAAAHLITTASPLSHPWPIVLFASPLAALYYFPLPRPAVPSLRAAWHPRIPNMVYYGMDWLCPSYNSVLAAQLTNHSGALTPELIVSNVLPIVQTGDVHAVVYDLTDQQMYVSFYVTNASSVPTPVNAYDRAFTQLDLNALFAEPAPTAASVHAVFV